MAHTVAGVKDDDVGILCNALIDCEGFKRGSDPSSGCVLVAKVGDMCKRDMKGFDKNVDHVIGICYTSGIASAGIVAMFVDTNSKGKDNRSREVVQVTERGPRFAGVDLSVTG